MGAMKTEDSRKLISLINNKNFFGLKSFNMGTALGVPIYIEKEKVTWFRSFFSLLKGSIMTNFKIEISGTGKLLFLFSPNHIGREFQLRDFMYIAQIMSENQIFLAHYRKNIDIKGILISLFFPVWFLQMSHLQLSFKQKLYLTGQLGMCKKWVSFLLRKINVENSALMTTFCDLHMYDNITAQYCRLNGIPTATLQHGIYLPSTNSNFSLAYELMVSDTFLAWGEYSKNCAIQSNIDPSNIYVAGITNKVKKIANTPKVSIFGVILSGNLENEQINATLIMIANEIAQKLNYQYIIKLHPNGSYPCTHLYHKDYLKSVYDKTVSMQHLANNVCFSICVGDTTALYELIHMGAMAFKHEYFHESYIPNCGEFCFKTADELFELINWSNECREEYEKRVNGLDRYIFANNSEQSYRLFFEKYLE